MRKQLLTSLAVGTLLVPTIPGVAAGQSSSPSAIPVEETVARDASLDAAPSGYTWTTLAPPTGAKPATLVASGVAADGTWAALAESTSPKSDRLVWHLGPTDTAVELAKIPKSAGDDPGTLALLADELLVLGSGKAWSSPDGSAWTPTKAKLKGLWLGGPAAGDGNPAVVLASGKGDLAVLSTADGETITRTTIKAPKGKGLAFGRIAVSPTGSVAVSASDGDVMPYLWSSPDGVTFTPATFPFDGQQFAEIEALAAAPTGLVMVASLDGAYASYSSTDGQAWTETSTFGTIHPDSIVALPASSGGGLLMIGNGVLYTSPDGVTWTSTPTPELEGMVNTTTAAALPDGRIVLAVDVLDDTAKFGHAPALLVATPQP